MAELRPTDYRIKDVPSRFDTLHFTCPADGCLIKVPFVRDRPAFKLGNMQIWSATGTFPDTFSLSPSVDVKEGDGPASHWHGHVANGGTQ